MPNFSFLPKEWKLFPHIILRMQTESVSTLPNAFLVQVYFLCESKCQASLAGSCMNGYKCLLSEIIMQP